MKPPAFLLPAIAVAALIAMRPSPTAAQDAPKQFDPAGSDSRAIAAVDQMWKKTGMPDGWAKAHYIEFGFGRSVHDSVTVFRKHCWDTWTNRYRIEGTSRRSGKRFVIIYSDVNDPRTAKVWLDGQPQTADSTVQQWGDAGHGMYINDSYWLLMPYKMKDPGVHLKWVGLMKDTVTATPCSVVELGFDNVGVTPGDHYHVWIDEAIGRVEHWTYESRDGKNHMDTMYDDYQQVGPLYLSLRRPSPGEKDGLVFPDTKVSAEVNEAMFAGP